MRKFIVMLLITAVLFASCGAAIADGVSSVRVIVNKAIMRDLKIFCFEQKIDVTEEQLAGMMEIMGQDYFIDDFTASYDIVEKH
jgi:hypothetical protein